MWKFIWNTPSKSRNLCIVHSLLDLPSSVWCTNTYCMSFILCIFKVLVLAHVLDWLYSFIFFRRDVGFNWWIDFSFWITKLLNLLGICLRLLNKMTYLNYGFLNYFVFQRFWTFLNYEIIFSSILSIIKIYYCNL